VVWSRRVICSSSSDSSSSSKDSRAVSLTALGAHRQHHQVR
jgi:hypothetical protein